jgi:hypothetical protein
MVYLLSPMFVVLCVCERKIKKIIIFKLTFQKINDDLPSRSEVIKDPNHDFLVNSGELKGEKP